MIFKRCYGCMGELDSPGAVCRKCGYDNTNDPGRQPSHVLPCGTILNGQYMVGRSLGQGGFGITYIGYDLNLEIPVCIKEYYPEGAASRSASQSRMVYWGTSENAQGMKESRKSFVKEAQKAVKLRNLAHVVTVWGVFYENETAYIVMDYIEGETLKNRLVRTQKTLGERECVELLAPVMEDLEKAHARGIIHRDIKPDNIMLGADGEPTLLDMGAAKDLGKSAQNGSTLSSAMVVSKGFSPLEQYRENGSIGPWTDVYALCATISYCVTGKVLASPIDRMVEESIDLNAFSPAFAAVMEKGLAIRPEDRIQSMGELIAALRAAIEEPERDREAERLERERQEQERLERERQEQERLERERQERERLERERLEESRRDEQHRKQQGTEGAENNYQFAKSLMALGGEDSISEALRIFETLGKYRDSAALVKKCKRELEKCKLRISESQKTGSDQTNEKKKSYSACQKRRFYVYSIAIVAAMITNLPILHALPIIIAGIFGLYYTRLMKKMGFPKGKYKLIAILLAGFSIFEVFLGINLSISTRGIDYYDFCTLGYICVAVDGFVNCCTASGLKIPASETEKIRVMSILLCVVSILVVCGRGLPTVHW